MKIINIHKRLIQEPANKVGLLLDTLATKDDQMLATDKWPAMRLDKGLSIGSKGGHGSIKYFVKSYQPRESICFQFTLIGFNGYHKFQIIEIDKDKTELMHIIDMHTTGMATLKWVFIIRWLHDAFIEDAFDKIENSFTHKTKKTKWSIWVIFLRKLLKPKKT